MPILCLARSGVKISAALLLAALTCCGSNVTSSSSGSSTADGSTSASGGYDWTQFCTDVANRTAKCAMTTVMVDQRCLDSHACFGKVIAPSAQGALMDCLAHRPCGSKDDNCFADPTHADPGFAKFQEDCLAKRQACAMAGQPTYADDFCGAPVLSASLIQAFSACFAKSCAAAKICVGEVAASQVETCPMFK